MTISKILSYDLNSTFLYLFILFADLDYASITDYTVKAVIGGAIWFAFKVASDFYLRIAQARSKRNEQSKKEKR